jgi:hypothetical protein
MHFSLDRYYFSGFADGRLEMGDAMRVAAEILQHIFGAAKGTFQVDDPVLSKQWPEPSSKDLGFGEQLQFFGEAELTILEGLPEGGNELATKDLTQYLCLSKTSKDLNG